MRDYPRPASGLEDVEHDLYDLLTAMVERTPWRGEEEKRKYTELIAKLREINVFGYMATQTRIDIQERR